MKTCAENVNAFSTRPHAVRLSNAVRSASGLLLAIPALLFVLIFLIMPAAVLFSYSIMTQAQNGNVGLPLTLEHFAHLVQTPLYTHVFFITLRISLWTTMLSVLLGYPVALVMTRASARLSRFVTVVLLSPLVVSIVVRTYGWELVLANNNAGLVNWVLSSIGLRSAQLRVMYSETAVVIGSLHVFLPMLVLPLAAALARINPSLDEAARTLGAGAWRVFWRATMPLSLPGLIAGVTIVFSLTAASYITPALLGGNRAQMLGNLLEQQVVSVNNWPAGSSIATLMVVMTFAITGLSAYVIQFKLKSPRRLLQAA